MVIRQSMDLYLVQYHQAMKRSAGTAVKILLLKRRERFTTTTTTTTTTTPNNNNNTISIFFLSFFILFFVCCLILGRAHILEQRWPNHSIHAACTAATAVAVTVVLSTVKMSLKYLLLEQSLPIESWPKLIHVLCCLID